MFEEHEHLDVASNPHWRDGSGLPGTHQRWLFALLPAVAASVWLFGWDTIRIIGLAVVFSTCLDSLTNRLIPSKDYTANWSSVTLAVIFALLLPCSAPWWMILVGCFLMIVVGKKLFGGTGSYPVHPALLSFAMLQVSWPQRIDYTASLVNLDWGVKMIEPLRLARALGSNAESLFTWQDLLVGKQAAGIGNGLVLFLLAGGLFLLVIREISWQIPAGFIAGNLLMAGALGAMSPDQFASPMFYLLSGGTVFAAFFLATDHSTSPVNPIPMLIYGFAGGALLMIIRGFSNHVDGVVFAILLVNLCTPLLDRITPKVRGLEGVDHA